MKTAQKLLTCLLIVGLLISQSFTFALASGPSDLLTIQANSEPGSGSAQISIKPLPGKLDKLEVLLPEGTAFDLEANREANPGLTLEYDSSRHTATFISEEPLGPLKLLLTDIQHEQNVMTLSSWSQETEIEKTQYEFSVVLPAVEEPAEEAAPVSKETTPDETGQQAEAKTETNSEPQQPADTEKPVSDTGEKQSEPAASEKPEGVEETAAEEEADTPQAPETDHQDSEPVEQQAVPKQPVVENALPLPDELLSSVITPYAGDLNIDLDLTARNAEVLAGKDAAFYLTLKVTGSQTAYSNAVITVDLPKESYMVFEQDLSELTLAGVTPTYDEATHSLIYEFESLKSGQTYERYIKVKPLNGYTPDNEEVSMKATFSADGVSEIADSDSIKVKSSVPVELTKKFTKVRNSSNNIVKPGSETIWEIKASIPKLSEGQMFLDEAGQIVITDILPSGLTYAGMQSGPAPTQNGNQLTWTFDAPAFQEQENTTNELFSTTLEVILKVKTGTADTTQENQARIDAEGINNAINSLTTSDSVQVTDSIPGDGTIIGTTYTVNHFGPADDKGTVATADLKNPNPIVHDDALLGFAAGIASFEEVKYGDFRKYTTHYMIDSHLNLSHLKLPNGFMYRPGVSYPPNVPLAKEPVFDVMGFVNGQLRTLISAEQVELGRTYTRSEMGLLPDDKVSEVRLEFSYAPAGMLNTNPIRYHFTVEKGYVGEVRNRYNVTGIAGNGAAFDKKFPDAGINSVYGPRTAQIVPKPDPVPPVATVGVEFLDHNNGEVVPGPNRLSVRLNNTTVSNSNMTGPLETVVLLPSGVTLSDSPNPSYAATMGGSYEIISNDHNGSGRQLVKLSWNDTRLGTSTRLTAELDIVIGPNAPSSMQVDVYGFSGDAELLVPQDPDPIITDTVLQTDTDDLNGDGVADQPRLKSGNIYNIRTQYDVQTEKLVKGDLDDSYSSFAHTTPGGKIDYLLKLTNTTGDVIRSMTLMDVLPSVGDLGITDNIERGSQFTPSLSGPITLPAEWQDKVNVFYSTATNPERDDLTRNTRYPEATVPLSNPDGAQEPNWTAAANVADWSSIHSFKLELKDGTEWVDGADITILFSMTAPSETEVPRSVLDPDADPASRAAWNSFALATNHGQPVEPVRVGVYMDYEIEDPVVEKTINGQSDSYELTNRDELFTWEVNYDFGNYTSDWNSASLSDKIHDLLDVVDVQVLDQDGNDVTGTGTLTVENNLVTFTPAKQNDSFGYLANQTYKLIIESKIKDSVTNEELLPFINGTGIPNQAELIVDDTPTKSNEVVVYPPGYGHLQIVKVDAADDSILLEGAEFELQRCEPGENEELTCTTVSTGTTNADGTLDFKDLPLGDYRLVETKAPEGYTLLTAPIDFQLSGAGETFELTVENTLTGWDLPETGGMGTVLFYGGGAALMALAGFMLIRRREDTE